MLLFVPLQCFDRSFNFTFQFLVIFRYQLFFCKIGLLKWKFVTKIVLSWCGKNYWNKQLSSTYRNKLENVWKGLFSVRFAKRKFPGVGHQIQSNSHSLPIRNGDKSWWVRFLYFPEFWMVFVSYFPNFLWSPFLKFFKKFFKKCSCFFITEKS